MMFCCPNTSRPKYARVAYLGLANATIFGFFTTFKWLTFGNIPLALFRVQKVGLVHFNNTLKWFERNLLQSGKKLMPPVKVACVTSSFNCSAHFLREKHSIDHQISTTTFNIAFIFESEKDVSYGYSLSVKFLIQPMQKQ